MARLGLILREPCGGRHATRAEAERVKNRAGVGKTPARVRGNPRPAGAAWGDGAPRSARVGFGA